MIETQTIPRQKKGASFDVRVTRTTENRDEAVAAYVLARQRLLSVSQWGVVANESPSGFQLTDNLGNDVDRLAIVGDHIKIHLPAPRSWFGGGADWVVIEHIAEDKNVILDEVFTAMTVRPSKNPQLETSETAHFFSKASTNTLMVCRHRTELVASAHGRNEQANSTSSPLENFRNMVIALPSKAGISNPHWKKLANGFIEK